jgi:hypothetical protein
MLGEFHGNVGIFEGPDELRGEPILVRCTCSRISQTRARWEQAFSEDGGETWETNWTMELTRVE